MKEKIKKQKGISALDFFCIGFGAIVGVGWAVSINGWMVSCGGPVPAGTGYIAALILMIPVALCYCEMVPMMPVAGGGMIFAKKAFNKKAAFISGWASFGAMVSIIPWEAIQITDLLGYLIPHLKEGKPLYRFFGSDIHLSTIIIGIIFSLLLFMINMRGLKSAATVQKILCLVLVGAAVLGGAAAIAGGSISNLTPVYDVTDPSIYNAGLKQVSHSSFFGGVFAILATAPFFLAGFETIPQGVEEAGGSIKSVGRTVALSVILACVFYSFLLFAFGSAWPWKEFAKMQRPAAASMFLVLYPGAFGRILYWIITIGAVAGLLTTWNGFYAASANMLMGMAREGLVPAFFEKQNKNRVAVNGMKVMLVLSLAGPFLGPNFIDTLTCFSSAGFVLSWAITAWSLVELRRKYPSMERPYKIPGGIITGITASLMSSAVLICMFIPASPFFAGTLAAAVFAVYMLVGIFIFALCTKKRRV